MQTIGAVVPRQAGQFLLHCRRPLGRLGGDADSQRIGMRISLLGGLRPFSRSGAVRDAVAGATLASMNIPQVLGYAHRWHARRHRALHNLPPWHSLKRAPPNEPAR